ncbi:hypothetical protein [Neobacillus mesonae]|uniref:hypothetical protein n=1 Tax=Neobacillus mesonae TaxID=1193713 RepID=UPI00203BBA44|nr:hypothetical protein [Neobacillus mesonae]MCM3567028.1 hypothetical protein [Neobacillus mesonae]
MIIDCLSEIHLGVEKLMTFTLKPISYRYDMKHNLFDHIHIQKSNTFVSRGTLDDIQGMCCL